MIKTGIFLLVIQALLFNSYQKSDHKAGDKIFPELKWVNDVGARKFPEKIKVFRANDFGEVNDGKTLNTKAIQKAIDKCSRRGESTGRCVRNMKRKDSAGLWTMIVKDRVLSWFQVQLM